MNTLSAPNTITIPWLLDDYRRAAVVALVPIAGGPTVVLPGTFWGIALHLAANCGWEPMGARLESRAREVVVPYTHGQGQIVGAADAAALAEHYRQAAALWQTQPRETLVPRAHVSRWGSSENPLSSQLTPWLPIGYSSTVGMGVQPFALVATAERNDDSGAGHVSRGVAKLADALEQLVGGFRITDTPPATWIAPGVDVVMVEACATGRTRAIQGHTVTGGEQFLLPTEMVDGLARLGEIRRVVETEAANV
jgi:hypothetical protein